MDQQTFDTLVARLEPWAARHPTAYRRRVVLLVLAGYAYLLGLLVVLIVSIAVTGYFILRFASAAAVKLLLILGALAVVIARSLWIRLPAPGGLALDPSGAPALDGLVEDVRRAIGGPRVHHVRLVSDFNAGVVQIPWHGLLGAPTHDPEQTIEAIAFRADAAPPAAILSDIQRDLAQLVGAG